MQAQETCLLPLRSATGVLLAHIKITATKDTTSIATAPLVALAEVTAQEYGESTIQLRESERYEYEVVSQDGADFRLRCSLAKRRRSLANDATPDAGVIETGTFCGALALELVDGPLNEDKAPVATAVIDVRSLKLDYRTEYRGMLRRIADEIAGLVVDARTSVKAAFVSNFRQRNDEGWLQLQVELLREILDGADFPAAIQRILSHPHERLSSVLESLPSDRPTKWAGSTTRQLVNGNPRRHLPADHPLKGQLGLASIAKRLQVKIRSRDLDTPENRFVKHVFEEFRAFLAQAATVFDSHRGWGASASLARRLIATLDDWLARPFFAQISKMRFAPLGSPVLHRRAGYREILRWWLRFRTAAELSWEGGEDIFHAGQRDVATLYEYWLFFELLAWFCTRCRGGLRPAIEELVDGLDTGTPTLKLKRKVELGPFAGKITGKHRSLNIKFSYNRRFAATHGRNIAGSWTRALHPDYTLTFWPESLSEEEADSQELLVHIHFDAKYRIENIERLFGAEFADAEEEQPDGNYKRQDLLKMHAYRDAIKRSQGAYVLYPGHSSLSVQFHGFHELLPGLGAFSVTPDENGKAKGVEALQGFLNEVIAHLSTRVTAGERAGYYLATSYQAKPNKGSAREIRWSEFDSQNKERRAPPPADHLLVIGMHYSREQLNWIHAQQTAVFGLNQTNGLPDFTRVRHLILRQKGQEKTTGIWPTSADGCQIITGTELSLRGYPGIFGARLYVSFKLCGKMEWAEQQWKVKELIRAATSYEKRISTARRGAVNKSEIARLTALDLLI